MGDLPFEYAPTSGPPGTTIEFSGECIWDGTPANNANVRLARTILPGDPHEPAVISTSPPLRPSGSFEGTLEIPLDFEAADYHVTVSCSLDDQTFAQRILPFEVTEFISPTTESAPPSTTSTLPTTTTTSTAAPTSVAPAQTSMPSFTG